MGLFNHRRQFDLPLVLVGGLILSSLVVLPALRWITARPLGPDEVLTQLKKHNKGSEFVCRPGEGDWAYYCDEYPNNGIAKRLLGVRESRAGRLPAGIIMWTSFPAGVPMSLAELQAFSDASKSFFARPELNTSRPDDFAKLPGVDRALAGRIVLARSGKRYETVDDLKRVEGLDQATLDRLRPLVRVNNDGFPLAKDFVGRQPSN